MKKKQKNHYITNEEIYPPLAEYVRAYRKAKAADLPKEEYPRVPEKVGSAVLLIAQNLATKGNFSGYSFVQDMIGDGYENCIRYIHNFDPDKSSKPFSYITLIISRAFIRRIQKEQVHSYIRHKLVLSNSDVLDMMGTESSSSASDVPSVGSVNLGKSSDVVQKFENTLAEKKAKVRRNRKAKNDKE